MSAFNLESKHVQASIEKIILAARCPKRVSGLTHGFYRYPARFSPTFVQAVIKAFSKPGDWVVDPFVGGGTTLVEALASGRNALGIDVSSLATFICEAKTLILTTQDVGAFKRWMMRMPGVVNMHAAGFRFTTYADAGYYKNLGGHEFWRLRKAIEQCLASVKRLRCQGARTLARCVVLRTAQWALDARKIRPSIASFRVELQRRAGAMLEDALTFRRKINGSSNTLESRAMCLNRSAAGAEAENIVKQISPPRLIVTSPPYPGIHILYHRWQVDGRRESSAPFWIANTLDGNGSAYYTMGNRKNSKLRSYFENLKESFRSIARIAGPETTIVQMVGFSEAGWQLSQYLEVMDDCGLREELPWNINARDGRLWRDVPNRKWHAQQKSRSPGSREVVLVHRTQ